MYRVIEYTGPMHCIQRVETPENLIPIGPGENNRVLAERIVSGWNGQEEASNAPVQPLPDGVKRKHVREMPKLPVDEPGMVYTRAPEQRQTVCCGAAGRNHDGDWEL